jgi:AraC family transcriptional regulator
VKVDIVDFPETKVAIVEHDGSRSTEHSTARKLVAWKLERGLTDPEKHRHYGLHSIDGERVQFCLSIEHDIDDDCAASEAGMNAGIIPACRCARARNVGSRDENPVPRFLFEHWLPQSGERASGRPMIFHYVNVGPGVASADMVTDVYLPLD